MTSLAHGAGVAFILVGVFALLVQIERRPDHDSVTVVAASALVGIGVGLCST